MIVLVDCVASRIHVVGFYEVQKADNKHADALRKQQKSILL